MNGVWKFCLLDSIFTIISSFKTLAVNLGFCIDVLWQGFFAAYLIAGRARQRELPPPAGVEKQLADNGDCR
jgi:hypothetical protein